MKIPTRFSKPSAELGTALTDRYRYNPYVRSTINIILLQVLLILVILFAFGYALKFQQESTVSTISRTIQNAIIGGVSGTPSLNDSLQEVRDTTLQWFILGLVLLTVFFGFVAARFALRPTRDSLQFQKQFIGNMAHEIRTPLAVIKTNTEVSLMDPTVPADLRSTLTTTLKELDRISEIINNLLSFETMLRPRKMAFAPINLSTIARSVVEQHEALAKTRGIKLTCQCDDLPMMLGNETGITQVVTNLVKNALNYTPRHADGSVHVSVRESGGNVMLSVADTGIGIAKKDLYYIFQPFYRADTSRERGVSGGTSGLGLAIVNEIVRVHNGKILVQSALDRGTTIEVSFPKLQPDEGIEKDVEEDDGEVKELSLELA